MPEAATRSIDDRSLDRDAEDFHRVLTDLIRVHQFRDRDSICCHGVSVTQSHALTALARGGGLTLNELAGELYLEKSTASRVVKGLQEKGYVERSPHPDDGRALQLDLTPEGRRLHEKISDELIEEQRRLLADFDSDVRKSMIRLVDRLERAATSRVETAGGKCCRID